MTSLSDLDGHLLALPLGLLSDNTTEFDDRPHPADLSHDDRISVAFVDRREGEEVHRSVIEIAWRHEWSQRLVDVFGDKGNKAGLMT